MAGDFATSVGFSAASALIDPAKELEHIQCPHLWKGVKHGFPLRLLLIGVYGWPRFRERGDEDGALGRLCCGGKRCACDRTREFGPG